MWLRQLITVTHDIAHLRLFLAQWNVIDWQVNQPKLACSTPCSWNDDMTAARSINAWILSCSNADRKQRPYAGDISFVRNNYFTELKRANASLGCRKSINVAACDTGMQWHKRAPPSRWKTITPKASVWHTFTTSSSILLHRFKVIHLHSLTMYSWLTRLPCGVRQILWQPVPGCPNSAAPWQLSTGYKNQWIDAMWRIHKAHTLRWMVATVWFIAHVLPSFQYSQVISTQRSIKNKSNVRGAGGSRIFAYPILSAHNITVSLHLVRTSVQKSENVSFISKNKIKS